MAREPIEDSEAFVTEVCWHYYIGELTQAEIAKLLNVTRLRVNRAIQHAKSSGMVKVQIESPFMQRVEQQEALKEMLGLSRVIIGPANTESHDFHGPVGAALAALLTERLATGAWSSFGVSWGLTLDAAIRKLPSQSHPRLEVVSLLGGTTKGSTFNSFGIASGIANVLGAHYSLLAAPIYLSEGIDRELFLSQYALRSHFEKFTRLDAVILTCSNVSEKSFLIEHGLPSELSQDQLTQAGAIGDVLGHFLDADGNSVSESIDNRTIGMPIDQVQEVPEKIMAAAGRHKVEIIKAACRRGLVDTLVTDDVTSNLILEASSAYDKAAE